MKVTKKLEEKIAIVTGAGREIGRAIALAYAKEGASVCCAARTSVEIESIVKEIIQNGGKGLATQTDVTNLESVKEMMKKAIDAFGGLDILVICAGVEGDPRLV